MYARVAVAVVVAHVGGGGGGGGCCFFFVGFFCGLWFVDVKMC